MKILFVTLLFLILCGTAYLVAGKRGKIDVGSKAPEIALSDTQGQVWRLSDALQQYRIVVVAFYPQDNRSRCTKQLCSIRDIYPMLPPDVCFVAISGDTQERHETFGDQYGFPFKMLVDEGDKVRTIYGAWTGFGYVPARVTYVINKDRSIARVVRSLVSVDEHVRVLKELVTS